MEYFERSDAERAVDKLNHEVVDGREIQVLFAKERRKTADDMRARDERYAPKTVLLQAACKHASAA